MRACVRRQRRRSTFARARTPSQNGSAATCAPQIESCRFFVTACLCLCYCLFALFRGTSPFCESGLSKQTNKQSQSALPRSRHFSERLHHKQSVRLYDTPRNKQGARPQTLCAGSPSISTATQHREHAMLLATQHTRMAGRTSLAPRGMPAVGRIPQTRSRCVCRCFATSDRLWQKRQCGGAAHAHTHTRSISITPSNNALSLPDIASLPHHTSRQLYDVTAA